MPVLSKEFLDIQVITECGFNHKRICDMIKTNNQCTIEICPHNTTQSFNQFDYMIKCSFKN